VAISEYEGVPPVLDRQAVDRIAALYFTNASKQVDLDADGEFLATDPPGGEVLEWPGTVTPGPGASGPDDSAAVTAAPAVVAF
jgi:hypothetical protein